MIWACTTKQPEPTPSGPKPSTNGVDLSELTVEEAGARLKSSQIAVELAGMLDQWTLFEPTSFVTDPEPSDSWGSPWRLILIPGETASAKRYSPTGTDRDKARETLERLAADADAETLPAASSTRLAFALG